MGKKYFFLLLILKGIGSTAEQLVLKMFAPHLALHLHLQRHGKACVLFVKPEWGFYPHILAMVCGYIMISICLSHLNKSKTARYQLVLFTLWFSLTFGIFWSGCLSGVRECFSKYLLLSDTKIKVIASGKGKNLESLLKKKKKVRTAWAECWII